MPTDAVDISMLWTLLELCVLTGAVAVAVAGGLLYLRTRGEEAAAEPEGGSPVGAKQALPPASESYVEPIPDGLDALRSRDPQLCRPALYAYLVQLARRGNHAAVDGGWDALRPFVSPAAAEKWSLHLQRSRAVGEVVIGRLDTRLVALRPEAVLEVEIVGYRAEETARGPALRRFSERWVMRRAAGARSLEPGRIASLRCPACDQPVQLDATGRCMHCSELQLEGRYHWQMIDHRARPAAPLEPLPRGYRHGGVQAPVWRAPDLEARVGQLRQQCPDFDLDDVLERTRGLMHRVLTDTREDRIAECRALCSDLAWQQLRFELAQFAQAGHRLRRHRVEILAAEPAHLDLDPFYSSLTVRVWWSMVEAVVDAEEREIEPPERVSGSIYVTLQRQAGEGRPGFLDGCPSCGAPRAEVDADGECRSCCARVVDGQYSWVLARIADVGDVLGASSTTGAALGPTFG